MRDLIYGLLHDAVMPAQMTTHDTDNSKGERKPNEENDKKDSSFSNGFRFAAGAILFIVLFLSFCSPKIIIGPVDSNGNIVTSQGGNSESSLALVSQDNYYNEFIQGFKASVRKFNELCDGVTAKCSESLLACKYLKAQKNYQELQDTCDEYNVSCLNAKNSVNKLNLTMKTLTSETIDSYVELKEKIEGKTVTMGKQIETFAKQSDYCLKKGLTVTVNGIEFKNLSGETPEATKKQLNAEQLKDLEDVVFFHPARGNTFIFIDLTLVNNGTAQVTFLNAYLKDENGYSYDMPVFNLGYGLTNVDPLKPSERIRGKAAFEIPIPMNRTDYKLRIRFINQDGEDDVYEQTITLN